MAAVVWGPVKGCMAAWQCVLFLYVCACCCDGISERVPMRPGWSAPAALLQAEDSTHGPETLLIDPLPLTGA